MGFSLGAEPPRLDAIVTRAGEGQWTERYLDLPATHRLG